MKILYDIFSDLVGTTLYEEITIFFVQKTFGK